MFSLGDKRTEEKMKKHFDEKPRVYDRDHQHHDYDLITWQDDCYAGRTLLGYHDWVEEKIFEASLPNDNTKLSLYEEALNGIASWSEETSLCSLDEPGSAEVARKVLIKTGRCPKEYLLKKSKT